MHHGCLGPGLRACPARTGARWCGGALPRRSKPQAPSLLPTEASSGAAQDQAVRSFPPARRLIALVCFLRNLGTRISSFQVHRGRTESPRRRHTPQSLPPSQGAPGDPRPSSRRSRKLSPKIPTKNPVGRREAKHWLCPRKSLYSLATPPRSLRRSPHGRHWKSCTVPSLLRSCPKQ